ncbi:MAG TPA: hypothetical protein VK466_17095, partial [Terriglobales bacterium]|nr:hypothetical protein [Terriglobales bacterium]
RNLQLKVTEVMELPAGKLLEGKELLGFWTCPGRLQRRLREPLALSIWHLAPLDQMHQPKRIGAER